MAVPTTYPHYAAGWAVAGDTPFTWTKQVASSYGGTRNGMVIHWPKGITAKGEVRSQWHHVIDIAPTILEAAGLPEPKSVNGTAQTPIEGVSLAYTFADSKAPSRHTTQYFEIFGNRAIYHDGWLAGTVHRAAWEFKLRRPLEERHLGAVRHAGGLQPGERPGREEPGEAERAAGPLLEGSGEVLPCCPSMTGLRSASNAAMVGRPDLMAGRTSLTVYEGMIGMSENVFINVKNRSHTITAEVEIPKKGANGVILAQAGRFGGWSLYLKDGKPTYTYNWLGLQRYTVAATAGVACRKGDHPIRVRL